LQSTKLFALRLSSKEKRVDAHEARHLAIKDMYMGYST